MRFLSVFNLPSSDKIKYVMYVNTLNFLVCVTNLPWYLQMFEKLLIMLQRFYQIIVIVTKTIITDADQFET